VSSAQRVVEKIIALAQNISSIKFLMLSILAGSHGSFCSTGWGKRVMKKLLFASAALVALTAAHAASAADMAIKAAPRGPAPVATWTGCYVNGGAGYGFFRQEQHASSLGEVLLDETAGGSGWLGTVGGGCDYQFNPASGWGNWVVGAFADYDFMDLRGHLGTVAGAFLGTEKESSAVAAGGRIGYLVTPQILAYINGGWSSTRFDGVSFPTSPTGVPVGTTLPGHTFNGGFIGGGTEVAVAAFPGLYWRNEYRYAAYGSADLPFSGGIAGALGIINHESKSVQTITTSLVWKFNATPASSADLAGKATPRASDMAIKAAPRPVPVATTWTGCYVNGGAGYGFFRQEQHAFNSLGQVLADETAGGSGWLGKVGGGCDYQFSPASGWGNWVVGAFADYDFMDLRGHLGAIAGALVGTEKENSAAAAGGRIGYLVTPQILTYVNGGWSSTRFDGVSFANVTDGTASGFTLPGHTFSGGFIGGGTEVAVAAFAGLYWRNEYRYAGYESADLQFSFNGVPTTAFNHESKNVQTITTSLIWKFH
jgi:outer membrane immunogenic protein